MPEAAERLCPPVFPAAGAASRGLRSKPLKSAGFTPGDLRQMVGPPANGTFDGANWRDNMNYVRSFGYQDE